MTLPPDWKTKKREPIPTVSVPTESRPTAPEFDAGMDWAIRAAERIHLLYRDSNYFRSMPKVPLINGWAEIICTEFSASSVLLPTTNLEPCPECKGKGWTIFGDAKRQTCDACRGKGQIRAASSVLLPVPENHQAIASFASKVGAALSRHFGESHRGDRPDIDELFDVCENLSWIACQKIDSGLPVDR